jgi:hypothetical protein
VPPAPSPTTSSSARATSCALWPSRPGTARETNRSIGQALYISEKTVSVHISRILAKLDARGWVEAAGLALRLGLLDEAEAAAEQGS